LKTILVLSDFHSGHLVGLTPPAVNPRYDNDKLNALSDYRGMLYNWFKKEVGKLRRIDLCVLNGDAVDGDGKKSGGTEQITTDPQEQAEWAIDILKGLGAKQYLMTYGTPYHTGIVHDHEDIIARRIGCDIGATQDIEVGGRIFNFKHKVGGSGIPHGRATALLRDKFWNTLWADRGEYPSANIVVRSHVHYHQYAGTHDFLALSTPALQGYGSKFGSRQVSGTVDYGFVIFQIARGGEMTWRAPILRMPYQAPTKL